MTIKRKFFIAGFVIIVVVGIIGYSATLNHYIIGDNFVKYLQKSVGKQLVLQKELKATYDNKNFNVILCTPVGGPGSEIYVQVYKEKMNGLYYKPTYGARKGGSRSIYGMIMNYIEDGSNNNFEVVYGYNEDFKADRYEVKKVNSEGVIVEDISGQNYFLKTFQDIMYPEITFRGRNNKDITNFFNNSI